MAKGAGKDPIPLLEWVSAAFGLAIALALMGIIGREAISESRHPVPLLAVRVEGIEATQVGYVAKLVVTNQAGQTAARVELEGTAGSEKSGASIDYVPGHSRAEAGLLFQSDPRRSGLSVRVTGYQLP